MGYRDAAWPMFAIWALVMVVIYLVFYIKDKRRKKESFFDGKNSRDFLDLRMWMWSHNMTIEYSGSVNCFQELSFPKRLKFEKEGDTLCLEWNGMIIDVSKYVSLSRYKGCGVYRYPIHYVKKDNNNVYEEKSLYIEITITKKTIGMELTKQTLSRRYPNVKRITIKYELLVGSSFSENMKGTITLTPSDEYSVIIPCTNNTCTKKYIDIAEEVSTHIIRKETSFEVFAMCKGDESDNVGAHRCMTTVTCSCQVQYLS